MTSLKKDKVDNTSDNKVENVVLKPITIRVSSKYGDEEFIDVETFHDVPLAQVGTSMKVRIAVTKWEPCDIHVNVSVPTYVEEIDNAIIFAEEKCKEHLVPVFKKLAAEKRENIKKGKYE